MPIMQLQRTPFHKHTFSADLRFTEENELQKVLCKGPKQKEKD